MIKNILKTCIAIFSITAFGQQSAIVLPKTDLMLVPFLTKNNTYIYVDNALNTVINEPFAKAYPFTKTGYAIVENANYQSAIIDNRGVFVVPYTDGYLSIKEVNGVTLMVQKITFDKKLPIWKWDWNIMEGSVKKTAKYVRIVVRVLETDQLLFDKKMEERNNDFNFNEKRLDELHFVWNNDLYRIENRRFKKVKTSIDGVLDKGRYILSSKNKFAIWDVKTNKEVFRNLVGKASISVVVNKEKTLLDSINLDRFTPRIPKVLYDDKTENTYVYPQYDKVFPKHITVETAEQAQFLKDVDLIYSVNNSSYFLLGKFNNDHDVWAYDWLYLDDKGKVHTHITVSDFFVSDRIGYLVWPSPSMVVSSEHINKGWRLHKVKYIHGSGDLFVVRLLQVGDNQERYGLWNRTAQKWEISPEYTVITVLDSERGLYATQKEKDGAYSIYNNAIKQQVGQKTYAGINADGLVKQRTEQGTYYFYINLETGEEYKEK